MQTLKFGTEITAEYLSGVEPQLTAVFFQRFKDNEALRCNGFFEKKVVPVLYFIIRALCILLLIIAALLFLGKSSICNSLVMNILVLLFACTFLFIFWDKGRLERRLTVFRERIFSWVAKKRARIMLKHAAKLAPFQAEYDFRGDVLAYYRIKDDVATFAWNRTLSGFFFAGQGFIVFFKNEKQLYPFAIILHDYTSELAEYLKAQSLKPLSLHFLP